MGMNDTANHTRRERKRPARAFGKLDTSYDANGPLSCSSSPICPAHTRSNVFVMGPHQTNYLPPPHQTNYLPPPTSDDHSLHPQHHSTCMNQISPSEMISSVIERRSSFHNRSNPMNSSSWFRSWLGKKHGQGRNSTTSTQGIFQSSNHHHPPQILYMIWIIQTMFGAALAENNDDGGHDNEDQEADQGENQANENANENAENEQEWGNNNDDNNQGIGNEAGGYNNYIPYSTDKHWSYSHSINPYGYLDVHDTCMNQPQVNEHGIIITISSIHLVCDSPGAYYQGSNTYRNSATCRSGDTAKLTIDCK